MNIVNTLKDNTIDAPDGDYIISTKMMDYKLNFNVNVWKNYKSKTKVEVRDGLLETDSLLKASSEIINDCGYWGIFLERVYYDPKDKTLDVFIGS